MPAHRGYTETYGSSFVTKRFHNVHPRGKRKPARPGPTSLDRVGIRPAPTSNDAFQIVSMPDDYRCPFCPDHADDLFLSWTGVLEQPICHGCTYELFNIVIHGQDLWPPVGERVVRLERLSGKSLNALRLAVLQTEIARLTDRSNLRLYLAGQMWKHSATPRSAMSRAMRLRLDSEKKTRDLAGMLWRDPNRRKLIDHHRADLLKQGSNRSDLRRSLIAEWERRLAEFRQLLSEAVATQKDSQ
jgi:hypothetical protein